MAAPIAIVGAGFAGLATACRLGQAGRECVVLERRAAPLRRALLRRSAGLT